MAALFSLPVFVGSGRFGSVRFCFSGNTGLWCAVMFSACSPGLVYLRAYTALKYFEAYFAYFF